MLSRACAVSRARLASHGFVAAKRHLDHGGRRHAHLDERHRCGHLAVESLAVMPGQAAEQAVEMLRLRWVSWPCGPGTQAASVAVVQRRSVAVGDPHPAACSGLVSAPLGARERPGPSGVSARASDRRR